MLADGGKKVADSASPPSRARSTRLASDRLRPRRPPRPTAIRASQTWHSSGVFKAYMASLFWPRYFSSYDRDYGLSGSPSDSCYTLKAYIPDQRKICTVRVLLKSIILSGPDGNSQIFRAELRAVADGQLSDQGRDVVCKVAYGQRQIEVLQKEAELYNTKLRDLQGTVVPLMHGCYVDDTDDGPTGVLVLQYCGVPLTYELRYYSVAIRYVRA